jgi:hypothetical protein
MKKIIITVVALSAIICDAAAQRQKRSNAAQQPITGAAVQSPDNRGRTITETTPEQRTLKTDDPVGNGGIIAPDHAYQPAGTEGVGFFGNGTGGSTIGSTPESGGTGLSNTMPAGNSNNTGAASPGRTEKNNSKK